MQPMKLHKIDIAEFMKTLDSCKGDVFLETPEGDVLNLKSKLCQFAGLPTLIKGGIITEATLRCENPDDEAKLLRLNFYGQVPEKE